MKWNKLYENFLQHFISFDFFKELLTTTVSTSAPSARNADSPTTASEDGDSTNGDWNMNCTAGISGVSELMKVDFKFWFMSMFSNIFFEICNNFREL